MNLRCLNTGLNMTCAKLRVIKLLITVMRSRNCLHTYSTGLGN